MSFARMFGALAVSLLSSSVALAAPKAPRSPRGPASVDGGSRLTYDLSASAGSYNDVSYTEITLGLNWYVMDWLNWRNALFTRQAKGVDSVLGLDSSARFQTSVTTSGGGFGFDAFAGPGLRLANHDNNALFAEAGFILRLGGLRIGLGAKALNYIADRKDADGSALPRTDSQYFLILAGGGVL